MKKIAFICLLAFCTAATAVVYDETNFNSLGRLFQRAPGGHIPGQDDGPGHGFHHPGEECGACHSPGRRAEAYLWTMSGTFYADRAGMSPLKGAEVIMQDRAGNVISMMSNEAGNFWTNTRLASDPYAVASHGGMTEKLYVEDENGNLIQPADPADPRTWLYKTWAHKGGSFRTMATVAPVGGSTGNQIRMSCNMHHAKTGSRGALWSSRRPTLPSYPETGLGYRKHIYPILRSKCSPCHIPGATATRFVTKSDIEVPSTSVDHSAALDLMTYEGSTAGGYVKRGILSVVDPASPDQSLLLLKTLPRATHGGGAFWTGSSPDYIALRQWIAEGALNN